MLTKEVALFQECVGCPLSGKSQGCVVECRKPQIIREPIILFVGQNPGRFELEKGMPFVGPTSEPFVEKLRELGLWDHCVFTNIIRCVPPTEISSETLRMAALRCVGLLISDIQRYRPSYICLLGDIAAGAFFKQARLKRPPAGELVLWKDIFVGWTYHPAAAARNPNYWNTILDFLRYLKLHITNRLKSAEIEFVLVDNDKVADEMIEHFQRKSEHISCDFEVDCSIPIYPKMRGKSKASSIIMVGISDGEVTATFVGDRYLPKMKDLLLSPRPHKIFHNALFELLWYWRVFGKVPSPRSFSDTMMMFYLLDEERDDHEYGLKYLASKLLGAPSWAEGEVLEARKTGLSKLPHQVLAQYNANDAYWTVKLYEYLLPKIKAADLEFLLYEHVNPLQCLYALAIDRGIRVDEEYLRSEAKQRFDKIISSLTAEIMQLTGGYIKNPRSWQEKQFYIYKVLGIPAPDGKETANRKFLESLIEEYPEHREVLTALIEFSRVDKIYSSYISKWDTFVDIDGRIRPDFKFFGTRTGRLSVEEPPFHNFPSERTSAGKEARRFIIPSEGYCFLYADASQFEVRVMANKSGDKHLQETFFRENDVYTEIASIIFQKPPSEIDKNVERQIAKQAVLGIFYGVSPIGLSKVIRKTPEEAEFYIRRLQEEFPKVFEYMEMVKDLARKQGFVRNWMGRYRRAYAAIHDDPRALRQVGNFVIQSEASDWWQQVTLWFFRISYKRLGEGKVWILATIHDSLLAEVALGCEEEAVKCLRDAALLVSQMWRLAVPIELEYRFLYESLGDEGDKMSLNVTRVWREMSEEDKMSLLAEFGVKELPPKRGV